MKSCSWRLGERRGSIVVMDDGCRCDGESGATEWLQAATPSRVGTVKTFAIGGIR
jgi:hypothetical protein